MAYNVGYLHLEDVEFTHAFNIITMLVSNHYCEVLVDLAFS